MIEAILRNICTISVQLLCDKVQGEGQKYDFVLYGGGGGVWRGAKLYYIIIKWPLKRGETGFTTVQLNSRGQKSVTFSYYLKSTQVVYRGIASDTPRLKVTYR